MMDNFDQEKICEECYYSPISHSFRLIIDDGIEDYFYCCPAGAKKYDDYNGIEQHILIELKKINKPYNLIIDAQSYRFHHAPCVDIIIQLMNTWSSLLLRSSSLLRKIIIINQNMLFKCKLNYIWYSIAKQIRKKIIIDYDSSFSKLLEMNRDTLHTV
jgi:hypothetical protein